MVDVSGGTLAEDVAPTRLQTVEQAAMRLLDQVPADLRLGLVSFSTEAGTLVRPTTDRDLGAPADRGAAVQRRHGHRRRPPAATAAARRIPVLAVAVGTPQGC